MKTLRERIGDLKTYILKNDKNMTVFLFVLLLPHFEPAYFDACLPIVDKIYNIGRVISAVIILLYATERIRSLNKAFLFFALIQFWHLSNTMIQDGFSKDVIINIASLVICGLIISSFIEDYTKPLLNALLIIYETLIYINFISLLAFPKGMYASAWQWENWFLGFRNSFTLFFIPALGVSMIWNEINHASRRLACMMVICVISSILGKSATCLVIIIVISIVYLTGIYKHRWLDSFKTTVLYVLAFLGLVVFRVTNILAPLMKILGRSITLTGRTFIWDATMRAIWYSPIFGYGQQSAEARIALVPEAYAATSAHNFILEHLYTGGIIQFILVIVFFAFIIHDLYKYKNHKLVHCMVLILAAIYLLFLVESSFSLHIYSFLLLCGNAGIICKKYDEERQRVLDRC